MASADVSVPVSFRVNADVQWKEQSLAEVMAIAVLKGDLLAARSLCDLLLEDTDGGRRKEVLPIHRLAVDKDRVRVVVYFPVGDYAVDVEATGRAVRDWITDGGPLLLQGVDRIEVYEVATP